MRVTCQQTCVSKRGDVRRDRRLRQPKVRDQICDTVFPTEQVVDDDEPMRITEALEDGRQAAEILRLHVGFMNSFNRHMTMISPDSDVRVACQPLP